MQDKMHFCEEKYLLLAKHGAGSVRADLLLKYALVVANNGAQVNEY